MVLITGNTFPVKGQIKALAPSKVQWDPINKGWLVPDDLAQAARDIVSGAGPKSTGKYRGTLCPDCGVNYLSAYQIKRRYHCDACTREADPIGWANEQSGMYDGGDY
jgi:hypothetical protein